MAKKTSKKVTAKGSPRSGVRGRRAPAADDAAGALSGPVRGAGKQLVIVESPAKAKTINKYLGHDYVVLASIGHVRDLPTRNPKGVKNPVPGVDLEHDFEPTYQVIDGKGKVISDLKRSARVASDIWFATDPDREGEAIAWHVAEELGIKPGVAKRVMFNAITKAEIQKAFSKPAPINMDRVNAQQARRVLDRIVGYQVSPLLWKKVARGLSAGRVQSVAVRLIVERERAIRAFIPEEYWAIEGLFTPDTAKAGDLARAWPAFLEDERKKALAEAAAPRPAPIPGQPPRPPKRLRTGATAKDIYEWLASHGCFKAELVEVNGAKFDLHGSHATPELDGQFDPRQEQEALAQYEDQEQRAGERLARRARAIAEAAGLKDLSIDVKRDASGRGPAQWVRTVRGSIDPATPYRIREITTKRTSTRPPPPFITSTLQQAAANRLGFTAKRTMGAAQQLYQGVDLPGEGPVALITYMRTDSPHLSGDALSVVREYIPKRYGAKYLPEKPNFYASSNKDAQEAHEAIRPTNVDIVPDGRLKAALKPDQFRLYQLIWERFVACQMASAQWDSTAVSIVGGAQVGGERAMELTFRATGRVLVFDGFYKVTGVPSSAEEQTLPALAEKQAVAPIAMTTEQKFTQPPPRYSEASLIKTLEAEGIGRPSTYASIISVIQDRKYVEQLERRFYATALGEAVTDKLIEAFPDLLDVGYTREMEGKLDKVEDDHLDWVQMLREFYNPFRKRLGEVEHTLTHAKAEVTPAPDEYTCPKCKAERAKKGQAPAGMVYRLGKSGRFLSCATYPKCTYACPVDREGKPQPIESTDVACPLCGSAMNFRTGRFGAFLGCSKYGDKENPCTGILKVDKGGRVVAPAMPPLSPEPALPCPKCEAPMYLRPGKYGPWLGCSRFPKCRGRGNFKGLPEGEQKKLLAQLGAWEKDHPTPIIKTTGGQPLTGADGKPLPSAPRVDGKGDESLEAAADDLGL